MQDDSELLDKLAEDRDRQRRAGLLLGLVGMIAIVAVIMVAFIHRIDLGASNLANVEPAAGASQLEQNRAIPDSPPEQLNRE